ncbi:gluconokinase [Balneolaceae bacterium YR4-1]|uniref:Gluconokinase n=2 Tax=Halalkalibaculum roseum TaxID=2709311 RepID=A0A6M1SRT1_9BACT|nr:gluconokinase [Halalkalibaculum roseum]
MIYIVMGVSSSGKTLIGQKLAEELDFAFYDADDFHPIENVEKMESGQPLNDEDRLPWLQKIRRNMMQWEQTGGAVLACSALKKSYRDILNPSDIPTRFIYLKGSKEVIAKRMKKRSDHFMPESLLDSQFRALEEPQNAVTVNVDQSPADIVKEILAQLNYTK